jgi:hypothetical protein
VIIAKYQEDMRADDSRTAEGANTRGTLNRLVLHSSFQETVNALRKANVTLIEQPRLSAFDYSSARFPPNGKVQVIEKMKKVNLMPENGFMALDEYIFAGYDESKLKYMTLEGTAYFTSHSLVLAAQKEYIPVAYLSFYFYTRARHVGESSGLFRYAEDHSEEANKDYVLDRRLFLDKYCLQNSVLFVDGPLIGGNLTEYTVQLVDKLHKKNIIPIFFVKNSDSNIITDNIPELKHKYNSDMHWSYNELEAGQRTNFVMYTDEHHPKWSKTFCYLKGFNLSPQRIEMYTETYHRYRGAISRLMDLVYYLLLVHGDRKNPQIRPIAVAEKYAREVMKMYDPYNLMKMSGFVPTMNQERFGG